MSQLKAPLRQIWRPGDLFHNVWRFPRKAGAPRVDRLAGILRSGIVAPGVCDDGTVCSDLNLVVTGLPVPYDSFVFLHRFGERSLIYTLSEPGRFTVFVDPATEVLTPEDMGEPWVMLSQDEVYVRERVPVEKLIGVAVHPWDADAVLAEFQPDFERLGIPLYRCDGKVVWP